MNEEYEKSRENLEKHIIWYSKNINNKNRNEATTRSHLIDTLLFDCLGWNKKDDIILEKSENGTYADYTLIILNKFRTLIIEAKKEGIYFELPAGSKGIEYNLKTLRKDNKKIEKAIEQAMSYCQERGVPIGVVCNGHQLICFVASRDDGVSPLEGKAVIFDSLQTMYNEFQKFWNYLSKPGITNRNLLVHLLGLKYPSLPAKLSSSINHYPGFRNRNVLQRDLQTIGEIVIQDISDNGEIEKEFIEECYSWSGALSQYALLSKEILENRYAALFNNKSEEIPAIINATTKRKINIDNEIIADSFSNKPILLLGDVGVGKTIFIRNLMKVAAVDLFQDSINIYIDLGSKGAISQDLRSFILIDIERQLLEQYEINIEGRNLVRGVYNLELELFRKGIYADLKKINPQKFTEKEIEFLENKITNKEEHLKYTIKHISKGRKKQIIIILDNADQRDEKTQQDAFIIAQEIASQWSATVFVSIRPETFFKSKKTGALSGYHTKAFVISPPRIDQVVQKRLKFALKIADGEIQLSSLSTGIFIKLDKLKVFSNVLIYSFNNNRELLEFIDNLCNGNIRMALQFIIIFIGSGHINTEKILEIEEKKDDNYLIPLHEFFRSIVYENFEYFSPELRVTPIVNILDIINPDPREHFILMIIIDFTNRIDKLPNSKGFIEIKKLYIYLQDLGFLPNQIDSFLIIALNKNLLESEKKEDETMPNLVRVTSIGIYHLEKFSRYFPYIDAMIVDTPILDENYRSEIIDVDSINDRLKRAEIFCEYLDNQWDKLLQQKKSLYFNWLSVSKDLKREIKKIGIRADRKNN